MLEEILAYNKKFVDCYSFLYGHSFDSFTACCAGN